MAVNRFWRALDSALVTVGALIKGRLSTDDDPLERTQGNMAALYEWIMDLAAPGAASQQYEGHDHGETGPPIARSLVYSEDLGATATMQYAPDGTNWPQLRRLDADESNPRVGGAMFRYEASPNMPPGAHLVAWIVYGAANSDFELVVEEQTLGRSQATTYTLPQTGETETYTEQWFQLDFVPMRSGVINDLNLYARAKGYNAASPSVLNLRAVYIWEVPENTTHLQGGVEL